MTKQQAIENIKSALPNAHAFKEEFEVLIKTNMVRLVTIEHLKTLIKLIDKFGDKQINICIEEMSELIKALCKHTRGNTDIGNIKEEIADVYIMLMQMLLLFEIDTNEFLEMVNFKINRTKERLLNAK